MNRQDIFGKIEVERAYQDAKWGNSFDAKNTPNDWVTYIAKYLGNAVTMPWNQKQFQTALIKVATLAVAALEQDSYAPRHYDNN